VEEHWATHSLHKLARNRDDKALSIAVATCIMAILAIDSGTTGTSALVFDKKQNVIGRGYAPIATSTPEPGWVEQNPEEIFAAFIAAGQAALEDAGVDPSDVEGIGIANQRETTIVWDKAGAIYPAIVWQDRRTASRIQRLTKRDVKLIHFKTGLIPDAYFSASKLEWILQHITGARARADLGELMFGTVDSWLLWKLNGTHATDHTNASRTMLWNIQASEWAWDLLALFDVPEAILPEVKPTCSHFGRTDAFGASMPIVALVGDQQSALFAHGGTERGDTKVTYGTGCFMLHHTGKDSVQSKNGLLTTRAANPAGDAQFALEGSIFMAGAAIDWFTELGLAKNGAELDKLAFESSGNGVLVVPAFQGLGAPHWDQNARGAILGITRATTRGELARGLLEGIAFQCEDVLEAMAQEAGNKLTRLQVDGGVTNSDLLMRMQASLSRTTVLVPDEKDMTAFGAGVLAGCTMGWWDGANKQPGIEYEPGDKKDWKEKKKQWKKAVKAVRDFA
jgi:glycerol kinase